MRRSKYSCAHRESGRVRAGPRCSLPNGPRRAQSKGDDPEYSATCGHTYMLVSRRAHGETVNQGGTAEIIFDEFTVLDRIIIFCQGLFLCDKSGKRLPCLHEQSFDGQRTANGFAVSWSWQSACQ